MTYTWLDVLDHICNNCAKNCNEWGGGGNCPYSSEIEQLGKFWDRREAVAVLIEGLGPDNPVCEGLLPVDELVCGDYDEAYSRIMRMVEEPVSYADECYRY